MSWIPPVLHPPWPFPKWVLVRNQQRHFKLLQLLWNLCGFLKCTAEQQFPLLQNRIFLMECRGKARVSPLLPWTILLCNIHTVQENRKLDTWSDHHSTASCIFFPAGSRLVCQKKATAQSHSKDRDYTRAIADGSHCCCSRLGKVRKRGVPWNLSPRLNHVNWSAPEYLSGHSLPTLHTLNSLFSPSITTQCKNLSSPFSHTTLTGSCWPPSLSDFNLLWRTEAFGITLAERSMKEGELGELFMILLIVSIHNWGTVSLGGTYHLL